VTRVELRPDIHFAGEPPDGATLDWLHERSHEECFIANSVRTEITVLPPRPAE
jgi:organic hydroperoxide reductase OsmC/OhrA